MNIARLRAVALDLWRAAMIVVIGVIGVPLVIGAIFGVSPAGMLGLVSSVVLLQALAVVVGLGFSLHPGVILILVTSVACGIILFIFEIADTFADSSERVQRWIRKMDEITHKSNVFSRYGELMLLPIIWIPGIGLYGCAVIAWIFGWRGLGAIILMLTGWVIACTVVLLMALGLFAVII
jgi:uncharacterized membrane protein